MMNQTFSDRLKKLCNDYYNDYMETPPCPVSSYERMNSLLHGTRKPTVEELVKISEAYDVKKMADSLKFLRDEVVSLVEEMLRLAERRLGRKGQQGGGRG